MIISCKYKASKIYKFTLKIHNYLEDLKYLKNANVSKKIK